MRVRIGARTVRAPSGQEWRVGRRWASRRLPRWRKPRIGKIRLGDASDAVFTVPDFDGVDDLGVVVLALLAVAVVAIIVIPLLLFGIELILLGLLVATGIVGRTLFGRPWIVKATPLTAGAKGLSWRVVGWRRSTRLIDEVATSLGAGLDPSPAEASELIQAPCWILGRQQHGEGRSIF